MQKRKVEEERRGDEGANTIKTKYGRETRQAQEFRKIIERRNKNRMWLMAK